MLRVISLALAIHTHAAGVVAQVYWGPSPQTNTLPLGATLQANIGQLVLSQRAMLSAHAFARLIEGVGYHHKRSSSELDHGGVWDLTHYRSVVRLDFDGAGFAVFAGVSERVAGLGCGARGLGDAVLRLAPDSAGFAVFAATRELATGLGFGLRAPEGTAACGLAGFFSA